MENNLKTNKTLKSHVVESLRVHLKILFCEVIISFFVLASSFSKVGRIFSQ